MHQHQVELAADGLGVIAGLVVAVAVQHHLRPEAAGMLDLHGRRGLGHDDGDRRPQPLAMIGQTLGMIAGRGGDDAAPTLFLAQAQQLVQRAALLEGGGELQVLELHIYFRAGDL